MCNRTFLYLMRHTNANNSSKLLNCFSTGNKTDVKHMTLGLSNLKPLSFQRDELFQTEYLFNPRTKTFSLYNPNNFTRKVLYRSYCSNKGQNQPKIMDFPEVIWPSMFKTVRNWILSNFIIARYFDNEFNLPDFVIGSKQAVELVSGFISKGDVESLSGLVTPEVIAMVKESLKTFTLKQTQEFAIKAEDIYFCFPYEVGVMFPNEEKNEGEKQSRFVEITMCYHVLQGLKELRESGVEPPLNLGVMPEYQNKIFICNYRFIREFTKDVQDDWTINAINHFKPITQLNL